MIRFNVNPALRTYYAVYKTSEFLTSCWFKHEEWGVFS